jgi:nicotinate phosphoribosyltransferase
MNMFDVKQTMRKPLSQIYRHSLALLTDLYELTMAYGYWKSGTKNKEAVFNLFFRKNPFNGGFAIACGLSYLIDYLSHFKFTGEDLDYLSALRGSDGEPLFEEGFLEYLRAVEFSCDIDAVPEGTVVFPHEPLVRVKGPIIQAQIFESALLNIINFQTLIATKAARIRLVAGDREVVEFGLRRSQGIDGALAASWASYIGGCDATANVLAGKLFEIPVKGTHAHSWVMSFDSELEAFEAYARAMPNNSLFLVDTYDTLQGVKHAIEVGHWLRKNGHELLGIRLDSGDLAYLSIEARKMLDTAGFPKAVILASNELDEHIINSLNQQNAALGAFGVGTKLVTGNDQPALGGVYKLAAVREPGGDWQYRVKVSEQSIKVTTPGITQVRRFHTEHEFIGDMIFDESKPPADDYLMIDPMDFTKRKAIQAGTSYIELLQPIFRAGQPVYSEPSPAAIKEYARGQLSRFHAGIKRLINAHAYPVGLEAHLHEMRTELVLKTRGLRSR